MKKDCPHFLDFRRRIRSVKNTQQITRAMSSSRRRGCSCAESALAARPYAQELARMLRSIMDALTSRNIRCSQRGRMIACGDVLTGERGLAGAFQYEHFEEANEVFRANKGKKIFVVPVGKKRRDALKRGRISNSRRNLSCVGARGIFDSREKSQIW